ncbi:hypothetical protein IM53_001895 [Xanthomonas phaseoli pv. dieffenbachiae]|uniref:Uncharacterized protein n=1 Tax=Xanthomonas phaseoli pv. dieffenbachiae TaxID=92828 RepID=A0A1V9HH88_9XANT|nr:hypothetical protein IM53_001895 [Xanthomonas phaseoli pv. dieffenbachiae]
MALVQGWNHARITGAISTVYDSEVTRQPSISIAKRIGDVFFARAFDHGFSGQYRMLAIGLPHTPAHVKRFHSHSLDMDLPSQASVGQTASVKG